MGGGVRARATERVLVGFEMRLGWEAHIRTTGVVREAGDRENDDVYFC